MKIDFKMHIVAILVAFLTPVHGANAKGSFRFYDRDLAQQIQNAKADASRIHKAQERATALEKSKGQQGQSNSISASYNRNSPMRSIAQETDYSKCIQSICKVTPQSYSEEYSASTNQKLDKSTSDLIDAFASKASSPLINSMKLAKMVSELPNSLKSSDLTIIATPFISLDAFKLVKLGDVVDGKLNIDKNVTRNNLDAFFNKEQTEYLLKALQLILDIYVEIAVSSVEPEQALLISGAVRENHINIAQVEIRKFIKNFDAQLARTHNPEKYKRFVESFKKSMLDAMKPTFSSIKYFADLRDFYLLSRVANALWGDSSLSIGSAFNVLDTEKYRQFKNIEQILVQLSLKAEDPKRLGIKENIISTCSSVMSYNDYYSPTKAELKVFDSKVNKLKNNFFSVLNRLFSREKLNLALDSKNWVLNVPLSKEHQKVAFTHSLTAELKDMDATIPANLSQEEIFLFGQGLSLESGTGATAMKSCALMLVNPIPDAALLKLEQIGVGPVVLRRIDQMQGVVYHEMAHLFEHQINEHGTPEMKAKLFNLQNCLVGQQEKLMRTGTAARPDQYLTEDFADWLAEKVSVASKEPPLSNFICYLLGDSSPGTVFNKNTDDSHSSNVFRLIHSYFVRNSKIPPVCSETLAMENANSGAFSKCAF